jgi:hypothetical protein
VFDDLSGVFEHCKLIVRGFQFSANCLYHCKRKSGSQMV